jgi:hypothetical protein
MSRSPKHSPLPVFRPKLCTYFLFLSYMLYSTSFSSCYSMNSTFYIDSASNTSSNFSLLVENKYYPQKCDLKHPRPKMALNGVRPNFAHKKHHNFLVLCVSVSTFTDRRRNYKTLLNWHEAEIAERFKTDRHTHKLQHVERWVISRREMVWNRRFGTTYRPHLQVSRRSRKSFP